MTNVQRRIATVLILGYPAALVTEHDCRCYHRTVHVTAMKRHSRLRLRRAKRAQSDGSGAASLRG